MSESAHETEETDALLERLESAAADYEAADERVAAIDDTDVERLVDRYREITDLMERYEPVATSDGDADVDMEQFIEYQEELAHFVERLPAELTHREAFETVDEIMHKKWLKEADFAEAREALAPVREVVETVEAREDARQRYRDARQSVERHERELDERVDELRRLVELGEADIDAPVERIRDPIERYDDAVTEAFETFKHDASAREVLAFVESTAAFPLVEYRQPPEDLLAYVRRESVGTEPIQQLLSYAEYSKSKLDHYVEDAAALKRNVATHQTYLERLDAGPLTVDWPPPSAAALRWRCKELIPVVDRLDDPAVLDALRAVRSLADDPEYGRLRDSAVAQAQLTDDERERLRRGSVEERLERTRDRRERLRDALDEYGPL